MPQTVQDTAELIRLRDEIAELPAPEKLRLAAGLIECGKMALAETIAGYVVSELRAMRVDGELRQMQKAAGSRHG